MERSLGYAVVGLGIGKLHAEGALKARGGRLIAVCDIDEERLMRFGQQHPEVCLYKYYHEMLECKDIDIVSICTPSGMHGEMAVAAMNAGKHVLIEKPVEIRLDRIDRMIQKAQDTALCCGAIFQSRFIPSYMKIKETLESGRLGKIITGNFHVKWYRTQEYYDLGG